MNNKSVKTKTGTNKKKLVRTRSESNRIKIIVTLAILAIASITYYLIDSSSYVATVEGRRISKAEYEYFLRYQVSSNEYKEGLTEKTQQEKEKFWLTTADGQDPWEAVKKEALNTTKDNMILMIKAGEMGLKIDTGIKNQALSYMEGEKKQYNLSDKQYAKFVDSYQKMSVNDFQKILEKMSLLSKFKTEYLSMNYKEAELADKDIKAFYEKDTTLFDSADVRSIELSKTDDQGKELTKEQLDAKMKLAEEALGKIKQGEDIDSIIKKYTEQTLSENSTEVLGKMNVNKTGSQKELADWALSKNIGDSAIIETTDKIYVVKLEKRTSFEDVKETVKAQMEYEAKEKYYDDALAGWRLDTKYNIITNDRVYDSITYKKLMSK